MSQEASQTILARRNIFGTRLDPSPWGNWATVKPTSPELPLPNQLLERDGMKRSRLGRSAGVLLWKRTSTSTNFAVPSPVYLSAPAEKGGPIAG
ncbi:hypothetical protein SKAU_G00300270 [Synaphobranchus kaupii]|uniref:Uncharacterized protein n=1 Tax=Synaphobranchus kaupii TaxID=118154 RepID=A0A9Q1EVJ6_SYNKA|nr:hypothetical protein SKAU_G00300270 [Synaphobranchus kaupii]